MPRGSDPHKESFSLGSWCRNREEGRWISLQAADSYSSSRDEPLPLRAALTWGETFLFCRRDAHNTWGPCTSEGNARHWPIRDQRCKTNGTSPCHRLFSPRRNSWHSSSAFVASGFQVWFLSLEFLCTKSMRWGQKLTQREGVWSGVRRWADHSHVLTHNVW